MMLFSFALLIICALLLGNLVQRFRLPSLVGMIFTGIILGPHFLNLISPPIMNSSADLRKIALIIILIRAGLKLELSELRKVGRAAILMCFIPATLEIVAIFILAPIFFEISLIEAAIMGAVLAAVSPAVVVPRMLNLIENGYGKDKSIPQLIMAGASVDDIYVIVVFTSFLDMYAGQGFHIINLVSIPISIVTGIVLGIIVGFILVGLFKKFHIRDTIKVLIIICMAFFLVVLEDRIKEYLSLSGLLAVMALGAVILKKMEKLANRLTIKFSKIWIGAEIFLFVLVGAAVDITALESAGVQAVLMILLALAVRMFGVYLCLIKTKLERKEKLFCALAYLPKATVQAAIGGIPLANGVAAGSIILMVAVLAILITAPIGAIGIDLTYKKLLEKDNSR
jgi:NhaP-type Na+/H+ or K+/H+ antiporter